METPKFCSRFSFLAVLLALIVTLMAPFLIYMSATSPAAGLLLPLLYLLFVIYFWLTEFRTRAHSVTVEENRMAVREFFGFGSTKFYRYSEFEGFITSQQPGRLGSKEYIFLMRNGKRQVCISEFYHRNYADLKKEVVDRIKFLGEKEYKWIEEYRQMFR